MPVVLGPETWPAWLGEEPADARQLKGLLVPYAADEMIRWPAARASVTSITTTRA
jgi:putative SOS response-associated peptidase YedK